MKIKIISMLAIFSFFSFLSAKAEIKVKTLKSPETPLYGTLNLELSPPLIIGSEKDDHYFFTSLREIKVDKEGRIYALDYKTARIQVYDINGKYISTIGGKGQGPGEFLVPYNLFIDEKGNIYVSDTMTRKITVFAESWTYKESISLNELAHGKFSVDKEGYILFNSVALNSEGNMNINFNKLNLKEKTKKQFVSVLFLKPIRDGSIEIVYGHPYQQNIYFSLLGNGNIVLVKSLEPTIYYFSGEGEILMKVLKEEKSERITKQEKEKVFSESFKRMRRELHDKVYFPENRPVYSSLLVDDENRIYLEKFKPINDENSNYLYYVFNEKGKYLYNLVLSFRIECINKDFVYTIKIDEDSGQTNLLRFQIKNWEQIKKGI